MREGRGGTRSIFGWLLALALLLGAVPGLAAEQRYVYDELGRLIAVIDPAGETTRYEYDEAGNLTSVSRASSAQVSIVSFTPVRGRVGDTVSLFGTGFSAAPAQNSVTFNGTPAAVSASTTSSIVVTVPQGATSGPIAVTTPQGAATSAQAFTVVVPQPPAITGFAPAVAAPGAAVLVSGAAFEPVPADNQVRINTSSAVALAATDDSLTVRVPAATGGKITVTTPNGSAASADDLFIVPPPNAAADVAATARLAIDGPGAPFTLPSGRIGLALFDGAAGAVGVKVSVRNVSISSGTLAVYAPNGTSLASTSFGTAGTTLSLPALPATGSYGVRVTSSGGAATVAAWRDISGTLVPGTPVDVTFSNPGQQARFTYTAAANEFLGLDLSEVALAGNTGVQVLRPDGVAVVNSSVGAAGGGFRIPQGGAGDYTVVITPAGGATGSLRLTLWRDVGGALEEGTAANVAIAFRSQQARLTFTAAAGDFLGLDLAAVAFGTGNTGLQVLRPDGVAVVNTSVGSAGAGFRIPQGAAGTYTVIVTPPSAATGSVQLTLWRDVAAPLEIGAPRDVSIAFRNQQARLTFGLLAGDFLGFDLSSVAFGSGNTGVQLLRPDGVAVINTAVDSTGAGFRVPQGAAGVYTLILTPPGGTTGSARVRLWRDVSDTLTLDSPYALNLPFRNQQARFTFTAATSDNLGIDLSNVTLPANSGVSVLRPDGVAVVNTSFPAGAGASLRIPPSGAGTYTLIIAPSGGGTGEARVTLWSDVRGSLAIGSPANIAVAYRNQAVRQTFTATGSEFLGIDVAAADFPGGIQVLRPDGVAIVNTSFPTGAGAGFRISQAGAGTYTVIVTPGSGAVGAVRLTLWEDVPGTLSVGPQIAVAVPLRNQQMRKTFVGASGQNLGVDLSDFVGFTSGALQVLRPDGVAIVNTGFSGAAGGSFRIPQLGAAGTYTVIVTPGGGGTGEFRLRLWSDVADPLTIGSVYALDIPIRNQQSRLPFSGAVGDSLRLELTAVSFPSGGGVNVLRPDGVAIVATSFGSAGLNIAIPTLGQDGTYLVNIVPNAAGTGTMNVRVFRP